MITLHTWAFILMLIGDIAIVLLVLLALISIIATIVQYEMDIKERAKRFKDDQRIE